jgi:hypothetical protein
VTDVPEQSEDGMHFHPLIEELGRQRELELRRSAAQPKLRVRGTGAQATGFRPRAGRLAGRLRAAWAS